MLWTRQLLTTANARELGRSRLRLNLRRDPLVLLLLLLGRGTRHRARGGHLRIGLHGGNRLRSWRAHGGGNPRGMRVGRILRLLLLKEGLVGLRGLRQGLGLRLEGGLRLRDELRLRLGGDGRFLAGHRGNRSHSGSSSAGRGSRGLARHGVQTSLAVPVQGNKMHDEGRNVQRAEGC